MQIGRRGLLRGLGVMLAAPAIVRVSSLMALPVRKDTAFWWPKHLDERDWVEITINGGIIGEVFCLSPGHSTMFGSNVYVIRSEGFGSATMRIGMPIEFDDGYHPTGRILTTRDFEVLVRPIFDGQKPRYA